MKVMSHGKKMSIAFSDVKSEKNKSFVISVWWSLKNSSYFTLVIPLIYNGLEINYIQVGHWLFHLCDVNKSFGLCCWTQFFYLLCQSTL